MAKVPNAIAATGSYYRGKTHTNRHKVSFTPRTICAGVTFSSPVQVGVDLDNPGGSAGVSIGVISAFVRG